MFKIPSKYSISHYAPFGAWIRQRAASIWHSVPDSFVKPYVSGLRTVFVIGCGHSGTTLTAAKLGGHSHVFLIGRETNAFGPSFGAHCSRRIVTEWSYFAELEGKSLILEKTPKHVQSVNRIRRVIPDARFIATVRNPLDNIASLYVRFGNLDAAIGRWKVDNKIILLRQGERYFNVIRYEELTGNPDSGFKELCRYCGLPWESGLLDEGETAYDSVRQEGNMAIRAAQVAKEIEPKVNTWPSVLTERQASIILRRTKSLAERLGYGYSENLMVSIKGGGYDKKGY